MKILHLSSKDNNGGAAIAARRLHYAIENEGYDSSMLVQKKLTNDPKVTGPTTKFSKLHALLRPFIDKLPLKRYPNRTKAYFSISWLPFSSILSQINQLKPDIVHLHWINLGMMRIEDLKKINAPIVWSLHDMWPFTGGCHIDGGCGKYLDWCGDCPVLKSGKKNDLSYKVFKRKVKTYKNIDLTIVGLSNWLKRCAEKSFLFRNKRVVNLPNPINTNFFRPILKSVAKEILNLQANKKLILFGAMGATSDPNKGFKELTEALKKVFPKTLFELIVFGASKPLSIQNFDFPAHYKGRLNDQLSLQILYSAADVVLVPSLQENLSNIIMESLACGTPVVGFNIGGNSDMIDHRVNGYLAEPYDAKDLAKGIDWVVNHKNHQKLCQKAREKVLQKFDSKVVAKQYIALYNEILSKQSHK